MNYVPIQATRRSRQAHCDGPHRLAPGLYQRAPGRHRRRDGVLGHPRKIGAGRRGSPVLPEATAGVHDHRVVGHGVHGPVRLPAARAGQHPPLPGHPVPTGGGAGYRLERPGGAAMVPPRAPPAAAVRVRHAGPDHRHRHLLCPKTRRARVPRPGPPGADGRHAHPPRHQAARPWDRHRHVRHLAGHAGGCRDARPVSPAARGRVGRPGHRDPQRRAAPELPDRAADQLHLAQRGQRDGHLQRDPGQERHRSGGLFGTGCSREP